MRVETPCETCAAPCCRKYTVTISGHDAYRLSAGLRVPMRAFAEMCWSRERDATHRILLEPGTDGERHWYRIALRQVPDIAESSDAPSRAASASSGWRCVFLVSLDGLVEAWNERVVSEHADLRVRDFFAFLEAAYGESARRGRAPLSTAEEPPQGAGDGPVDDLEAALRVALPMPAT